MTLKDIGLGLLVMLIIIGLLMLTQLRDYIESNPTTSPSKTETAIATMWLWLRRVVTFIGASGMFGVVYWKTTQLMNGESTDGILSSLGEITLFALLGIFLVWIGIIGAKRGSTLHKDIEFYKNAKRRYRWRL